MEASAPERQILMPARKPSIIVFVPLASQRLRWRGALGYSLKRCPFGFGSLGLGRTTYLTLGAREPGAVAAESSM
jgi:hypothetical protein